MPVPEAKRLVAAALEAEAFLMWDQETTLSVLPPDLERALAPPAFQKFFPAFTWARLMAGEFAVQGYDKDGEPLNLLIRIRGADHGQRATVRRRCKSHRVYIRRVGPFHL